MKTLSKREGERCYKACYGNAAVGCFGDSETDSYYWFPRLFEKLCEVSHKTISIARVVYPGEYVYAATFNDDCESSSDPCAALCAAIEDLEAQNANPR